MIIPEIFNVNAGGSLDYIENFEAKNEDSIRVLGIHWRTLIYGIVIAAFLGFLLGLIGYIIATLSVGYSVGGDYKKGAIHGALAGFVGGIIVISIGNIIKIFTSSGHISTEGNFLIITGTLIGIIIYGITGAICGAIGAFIKQKKD